MIVEGRGQEGAQCSQEFYQDHLDRVSRSFAFCIARLPSPLREHISLGYLMCRIVDTIEDAPWASAEAQEASFRSFDRFLCGPESIAIVSGQVGSQEVERFSLKAAQEFRSWLAEFPSDIPEGEKRLLEDAETVFSNFHALAPKVRACLLGPIQSMSAGMRYYMALKASEGRLELRNIAEVNAYCFFVAGVVGEMLTNLMIEEGVGAGHDAFTDSNSLLRAFRFGLFLQKVNLLKDQVGDERAGRYLVPSRELVLRSLKADGQHALEYLLALPYRASGYRLFCAWSLFLGLASLPWIERAFKEGSNVKITRDQTMMLLAEVERRIGSNEELKELFEFMSEPLETTGLPATGSRLGEEPKLISLYRGGLTARDLQTVLYGVC